MKKFVALLSLMVLIISASGCQQVKKLNKFTDYSFDYFDTATTIIGYETDEQIFNDNCKRIKAQLDKYHRLYTIYNRYDGLNNLCELNRLDDGVHPFLKVDSAVTELIEYCKDMHSLTDGRVNIAMGSVLKLWHDYRSAGSDDPTQAKLPPIDELKAAAEHTDINSVIIDKQSSTVYLSDPELRLDVGAVAKGYAVERVAQWMKQQGMSGYLLNVGGNVRAVGKRADGEKWTVGIENPDTSDRDKPYVEYLAVEDMSLVTSGSYQRYYYVDGKRYHHIIDPDTLMPAEYFLSVSVLCEDSAKADALSTALFCMSYEQGSRKVAAMDGVEAMWVLPDGERRYSDRFKDYCTEIE